MRFGGTGAILSSMYVKRRKNASGSTSIQVIKKIKGKTQLVKTIGSSKSEERIKELELEAKDFISEQREQLELDLYLSNTDTAIRNYFSEGNKLTVYAKGPELVLGKIFDEIGFNCIKEELFRQLVLARLTYPVSKLKTTEYLLVHQKKEVEVSSIYRFLDRFHKNNKEQVEKIAFEHTRKILSGKITVVFYDMTTLYFEAEDEDDLRKIGFSKDGKFQCPQIMLGLFVGEDGYPIAYDIYEGNTFEGSTLIPAIERVQKRFELAKPTVIADSGLLSKKNLEKLSEQDYLFIIGARMKNESDEIKRQILSETEDIKDGESVVISKGKDLRLIISYSAKRAKKDAHNRQKGLARLENRVKSGKLTKSNISNRGYNKFLKIESDIEVSIDESKIIEDQKWDGLKGYITNSDLHPELVISNYNHLWKIERAFRISKSDLRIRPIYHRKKNRIEAHICIAFVAYTIFKELERLLDLKDIELSAQKVCELTKTIFQIQLRLPDSRNILSVFSRLTKDQELILQKLV